MTWWCAATEDPWSWSVRFYPGIWAMVALLVGSYVLAWRAGRARGEVTRKDENRRWAFAGGMVLLWLATDWPLGTLGSGYLASAHMLQFMLYTLCAAPLILVGTPEWMLRSLVDRVHAMPALRVVARPIVAGIAFNLILVATHAPWTVDTFRSSEVGSMVLDVTWILAGLVLWLPLAAPLPEVRTASPAARCVYLFLAAGVVPMIPGGFLTFSELPLYATYELAPRVHGFGSSNDQQVAGILMKIGSIPIVWTVIFVIFLKWAVTDKDGPGPVVAPVERASSAY